MKKYDSKNDFSKFWEETSVEQTERTDRNDDTHGGVGNEWIPFERWEKAEKQRLELERVQRMPASQNETYDTSERIPGKDVFDFTQ